VVMVTGLFRKGAVPTRSTASALTLEFGASTDHLLSLRSDSTARRIVPQAAMSCNRRLAARAIEAVGNGRNSRVASAAKRSFRPTATGWFRPFSVSFVRERRVSWSAGSSSGLFRFVIGVLNVLGATGFGCVDLPPKLIVI